MSFQEYKLLTRKLLLTRGKLGVLLELTQNDLMTLLNYLNVYLIVTLRFLLISHLFGLIG